MQFLRALPSFLEGKKEVIIPHLLSSTPTCDPPDFRSSTFFKLGMGTHLAIVRDEHTISRTDCLLLQYNFQDARLSVDCQSGAQYRVSVCSSRGRSGVQDLYGQNRAAACVCGGSGAHLLFRRNTRSQERSLATRYLELHLTPHLSGQYTRRFICLRFERDVIDFIYFYR